MARKIALTVALGAAGIVALLQPAAPGWGWPRSLPQATGAADKPVRIRVEDNFFDPRSASVALEKPVVWTWKGTNRHNVVFTKVPDGESRKGAKTRTEGRWKRVFETPGLYRYVCRIYAGMRGTVTVKPAPAESKRSRG